MSVIRAKHTLRKQFSLAWSELTASLTQIASGCDVRPNQAAQIFKIDQEDASSMKVEVEPVAFWLKEKAKDDNPQIYATVKGRVNFSIGAGMDPPFACFFKSEVGYFRVAATGSLDHILGIHYDCDDQRAAHPVFHAQLTSCRDHLSIINQHYEPTFLLRCDYMTHVARKVRLPTAHMDPLAVFVQLLADHLMNVNSGPNEQTAFEKARSALMFFKSDPAKSQRLNLVTTDKCFRGPRWYPMAIPQAAQSQPEMPPP